MIITIDTHEVIQAHDFFLWVQSVMNPDMYKELWGDSAEHYWNKFKDSSNNVIYFWSRLDPDNQRKLFNYFLENAKQN